MPMKRVVLLVASMCCLFALTPLNVARAQTAANNVTGTVTDPAGAVVTKLNNGARQVDGIRGASALVVDDV